MSSEIEVNPCTFEYLKVLDKRVKIVEVFLRCLIFCLGLVTAVLVGTDTQVKNIFSIEKKAKFTDMKPLVFLVIVNAIAAGFSLIQGLQCFVSLARENIVFSKALAWTIFSFDQAIAYVTLAVVAAAAQSAIFSEKGQAEMQWMKLCDLYGKFCTRVGEGMASAVVVSISLVLVSCLSAFNLFRLYDNCKGKSNGFW